MTPNILVAPCYGQPSARRHFHDTIEGWVPFADDERGPLLTEHQRNALLALHPSGVAHFWGARAGHAAMMSELKRGDVVLFVGDKKVKACGEVGHHFVNQPFADRLWRKKGDVDSFVHVYSVLNVRPVERPKSDLVTLCGYKPNYAIPGQRFLRPGDVPDVLREFGIATSVAEAALEELIEEDLERARRSRTTPVEKAHQDTIIRHTPASTTLTHRVEINLVEAYRQSCLPEVLRAFRTDSDLRADLYRESDDEVEIIEAKSLATHGKVREAVAQLMDYAFHSPRPVTRLTALFPEKPDHDGLSYLHRLGIDCLFHAGDLSFVREPAADTRRAHMIPVWRGA
ncbi:hypothetical protein FHS29_004916 [Saccharothrix tamanrassetensis]|uniref:Uncharacterized protein n=1 Tax=Saccharothrix tamanrassetensis TaxID=1051531 RepID=A0A841CQA2_9PSEU|nr:hypothetical protein [Saccharothrix tamanrassetensis]MBB5958308.1 hypothetical protein [Saccharothrix tamanrassetensis]